MLHSSKVVGRGAKGLGGLRALGVEPVFVAGRETIPGSVHWPGWLTAFTM